MNPNDAPKRAVYVRTSSDQSTGKVAKAASVAKRFGGSGLTNERPGFRKLLEAMARGCRPVQVELTRLARNSADAKNSN